MTELKQPPLQSAGWWTIPNALTVCRILGSPVAVLLAYFGLATPLVVLVIFLLLTEWLDGLLARLLHQASPMGARLDTVADVVFYGSLLVVILIVKPALVTREAFWIGLAIAGYLTSCLSSWIKFGRFPSYHTWAAKAGWFVVAAGIVIYLLDWSSWPFRIAMLFVLLTNVEATCITRVLDTPQVDVPSLWHARRLMQKAPAETRQS